MKVREVMCVLETHGFRLVRQKGSHCRFVGVVHGPTLYVTVA
jgi:predicted RNA binding protein YcfA (HicA-like mRNA interferase family)